MPRIALKRAFGGVGDLERGPMTVGPNLDPLVMHTMKRITMMTQVPLIHTLEHMMHTMALMMPRQSEAETVATTRKAMPGDTPRVWLKILAMKMGSHT